MGVRVGGGGGAAMDQRRQTDRTRCAGGGEAGELERHEREKTTEQV